MINPFVMRPRTCRDAPFLALFSYSWKPYAGVIIGAEFPEPALTLRTKSYENFTDEAQVQ